MAGLRFIANTFVAIFAVSLIWNIFSYSTFILIAYILGDVLLRKFSKTKSVSSKKSATISNAATFEWNIVKGTPTKDGNYVFFLFPDITISVEAILQNETMDVWLNRLTPKLSEVSILCEISLIDNGIEKIKESRSVTFEKSDRVHFITWTEGVKDCSPNPNMRCKISRATDIVDAFTSEGLSRDIVSLLENAIHADVIFEVMNERISAHKAILSARSKVFADMFQEVKTTETFSIDDVEPSIFRLLLQYVYSGYLPEASNGNNYLLYAAADKYSLYNLKEECIIRMLKMLSEDNICNYLLMADRHVDKALKDGVFTFIRENGKFLLSDKWDEFSKNNSLLAVETLNDYIKYHGPKYFKDKSK